jgi:hypothetical protein
MAAAVLVFDASPLSHFARANELDTLRVLVAGFECVTTKAVRSEMRRGAEHYPALDAAVRLDWVATVPCDDLDELYLFGQYMNRLGNLERNAGEASVLAGLRPTVLPPTSTIRWLATWGGPAECGCTARCT